MKQVCKFLAVQSTLNMLGDRKGGVKVVRSAGQRSLMVSLQKRGLSTWCTITLTNPTSLFQSERLDQTSRTSVFCLFGITVTYNTDKQRQSLILHLPALPLFPPPLSVWYHHSWQAADSDEKLVNTDRDTGSSAAVRVSSGVQPRSMSVRSVRLSPSERVDPGDWVIERLMFEPADSPNKLIPSPTITNPPPHPITNSRSAAEGEERGKFSGQGFSGASQKKLLNDLISGDIHLL